MNRFEEIARNELQSGIALREQAVMQFPEELVKAATLIADSIKNRGKLLLCGNGGSAADAQHYATELVARLYKRERPAMAAIALTTDTSALTALANDYGFDRVFARQVEALGRPGDVLLGLSTSGNSANVIEAIHMARSKEMKVISFTGQGGKMQDLSDITLAVQSDNTMRIQEIHLTLGHVLCKLIEEMVFPDTGGV